MESRESAETRVPGEQEERREAVASTEPTEPAEQEQFRLRLEGQGVLLDRPISAALAAHIFHLFHIALSESSQSNRPMPTTAGSIAGSVAVSAPSLQEADAALAPLSPIPALSPLAFYAASLPTDLTYCGKIAALAAYLRDQEGKADFDRSQMRDAFERAHWREPKVWQRELDTVAVGKRHVLFREKGRYRLTEAGDQAIAAGYVGLRKLGDLKLGDQEYRK